MLKPNPNADNTMSSNTHRSPLTLSRFQPSDHSCASIKDVSLPRASQPSIVTPSKQAPRPSSSRLKLPSKVSAQFKSPLMASSSQSRPGSTRVINDLEREIQVLKRAVTIRKNNDEEKLEQLTKKWRNAGREAAWELWDIVRASEDTEDTAFGGEKGKAHDSGNWGWGEDCKAADGGPMDAEGKCARELDDVTDERNSTQTKTCGTMLLRLGIAHETLGWVDSDEDFIDS